MIETDDRAFENHVRAVLRTVGDATGVAPEDAAPGYVGAPAAARRRAPRLLLAAAAAAAVVLGAVAIPRGENRPASPPAAQPTPPTSPSARPPGPAGGRLIAEGTVSGHAWALYGADHVPGLSDPPGGKAESPCWVLAVERVTTTSAGCDADPGSGSGFRQLGPVFVPGETALVFGVLSPDVRKVLIQVDTAQPVIEVIPGADPQHPSGARYFVAAVPRVPEKVTVRMLAEGEVELRSAELDVDGPIGG